MLIFVYEYLCFKVLLFIYAISVRTFSVMFTSSCIVLFTSCVIYNLSCKVVKIVCFDYVIRCVYRISRFTNNDFLIIKVLL